MAEQTATHEMWHSQGNSGLKWNEGTAQVQLNSKTWTALSYPAKELGEMGYHLVAINVCLENK